MNNEDIRDRLVAGDSELIIEYARNPNKLGVLAMETRPDRVGAQATDPDYMLFPDIHGDFYIIAEQIFDYVETQPDRGEVHCESYRNHYKSYHGLEFTPTVTKIQQRHGASNRD